ncbi:MAG: general secretion pathway protein GspK [Gemmatimonadetes bacterium]|uniref:General secretion pathway protein GspK n=1 Tax=Candidatus Kutchimonas denitrificans TaxID=3056748 RepID=A0AAE4Z8L2_9BACT|nr:general secretion pathway protein GspK [Gemmatimonadota bacterium]NIR74482.1 general secretion pathway protein GspK [Candidatus Kutchimonas denitrificans]NIR99894.1 general secretion pathway protein GspK [Gemmatimonadota bacterium]NIT66720.1 general secretion pathway protein GspK [Gemmatimonadota bacterium]NIU52132.1 hypothetical protein [Gemmatimonadota bacterium]
MRSAERRGVALMLVLWLIVVVGAVAASVVTLSRRTTDQVATIRSRTVARYAAESGVAAASVQLERMYREARTPEERATVFARFQARLDRAGAQALGTARYQLAAADLNARIDLNRSDRAMLLGLFAHFFGPREAERLAEALRDWTDSDEVPSPYGGEAPEYLQAGSPFYPPNRPLLRLDELTRILGFTDSIADVLAPYITIHGDGRVNVNSAPFPVLAAVPELGASGAELLVGRRERGEFFGSLFAVRDVMFHDRPGQSFQPGHLTTLPTRILIVSRGWEDGAPLTHEIQAVFELGAVESEGGPPLEIRFWTERDL